MRWLAVVTVLFAAASAHAHDVWITFEPDRRAVVNYGHPGDRLPPQPEKLFELRTNGGDSLLVSAVPATVRKIPVLVTTVTGATMLTAQYDNGYWVETDEGYRNASKRNVPGATKSLSSMKFAKALRWGAPYDRVVGHRLEIVPLDDPFAIKPGGSLRVRVLFDGKPLEGAAVENGDGVTPMHEEDIPRYKAGADGIATVPVTRLGLQLLAIDHDTPGAMPALADKDLFNATLTLVVAK